jgi:hypothetical protein
MRSALTCGSASSSTGATRGAAEKAEVPVVDGHRLASCMRIGAHCSDAGYHAWITEESPMIPAHRTHRGPRARPADPLHARLRPGRPEREQGGDGRAAAPEPAPRRHRGAGPGTPREASRGSASRGRGRSSSTRAASAPRSAIAQDALERLAELVARAEEEPKPRIPTRPSRAAKARRTDAKTQRGTTKRLRRPPGKDE